LTKKRKSMIPVTQSFLPPLEEYMAQVKRAFENKWLTNRGELVKELEFKLSSVLGLKEYEILITNNGTIPLQIAANLLGKQKEIITTPFSYVATTASILWENCTPVFVDIDEEYLTIDESKIEAAITENTTCILATHVFGFPCNVEAIQAIADKYQLKVIYDAAHCFGVRYLGKSLFEFGDVSTCSFHATKLFHTGEGGALFCKDKALFNKLYYSHNFGHDGPLSFHGLGINGKISELQAAMGLAVLPYLEKILEGRKFIVNYYLQHLDFSKIKVPKIREGTEWNYSYFPVLFENEAKLLLAQDLLNKNDIVPRRYFYPSLSKLPYLDNPNKTPISDEISTKVLCLPMYIGLTEEDLNKIVGLINFI
jgi:dTDP-4-amino-4,6-dideoxygalactose transaminase